MTLIDNIFGSTGLPEREKRSLTRDIEAASRAVADLDSALRWAPPWLVEATRSHARLEEACAMAVLESHHVTIRDLMLWDMKTGGRLHDHAAWIALDALDAV